MKITNTPTRPATTPQDEAFAVKALAALAQTQRLRAFRALVVAGANGLTPSAMAEYLGIAASALSFHLKELAHAGLVSSEPRGRNLIYRADFAHMNTLLAYLSEQCCQGETYAAAADTTSCTTC